MGFLQRVMFIISSLYQHFVVGYLKLKKMLKREAEYARMQKLKQLRRAMKQHMPNQNSLQSFAHSLRNPKSPKRIMLPNPRHIWYLSDAFVHCVPSNKQFRLANRQKLQCGGCNKPQSSFSDAKLRVCQRCRLSFYCSSRCQKYDWKANKH